MTAFRSLLSLLKVKRLQFFQSFLTGLHLWSLLLLSYGLLLFHFFFFSLSSLKIVHSTQLSPGWGWIEWRDCLYHSCSLCKHQKIPKTFPEIDIYQAILLPTFWGKCCIHLVADLFLLMCEVLHLSSLNCLTLLVLYFYVKIVLNYKPVG